MTTNPGPPTDERDATETALDAFRAPDPDGPLTTGQGVRVNDTDNSLTVGDRGSPCWRTSSCAEAHPLRPRARQAQHPWSFEDE